MFSETSYHGKIPFLAKTYLIGGLRPVGLKKFVYPKQF